MDKDFSGIYLIDEHHDKNFSPVDDFLVLDSLVKRYNYHHRQIEIAKKKAEASRAAQLLLIDNWLEDETAADRKALELLEPLIQGAVKRQLTGTNKKSVKLPHGSAGFRAVAPCFSFHGKKVSSDNSLFAAVLEHQGLTDFIKHKPVVDWERLKPSLRIADDGSVCTNSGEIIEGLSAEISPDKFFVRAPKVCYNLENKKSAVETAAERNG